MVSKLYLALKAQPWLYYKKPSPCVLFTITLTNADSVFLKNNLMQIRHTLPSSWLLSARNNINHRGYRARTEPGRRMHAKQNVTHPDNHPANPPPPPPSSAIVFLPPGYRPLHKLALTVALKYFSPLCRGFQFTIGGIWNSSSVHTSVSVRTRRGGVCLWLG